VYGLEFIIQPVPYESGLSSGFAVGKKLLIFGTPEKKARRFNVNLLRKNGDIALHFNLRFDEKVSRIHSAHLLT
jgi:hypothetical protein